MKRLSQLVCSLLVLSMILAIPALAMESTTWGSDYFLSRSCSLHKTSSSSFEVWFDVTAMRTMSELGVSTIEIQKSTNNGSTWSTVKSYSKANYSNLICSNTTSHASYVTYSGASTGCKYRAYVCFYAKNSSGSSEYVSYTSSITLP